MPAKTVREVLEDMVTRMGYVILDKDERFIDQALADLRRIVVPEEKPGQVMVNNGHFEHPMVDIYAEGFNECRSIVASKFAEGENK